MQDHKILHKTESGFPLKYMLHKDLVPEISHDLILILALGIAPGPRS